VSYTSEMDDYSIRSISAVDPAACSSGPVSPSDPTGMRSSICEGISATDVHDEGSLYACQKLPPTWPESTIARSGARSAVLQSPSECARSKFSCALTTSGRTLDPARTTTESYGQTLCQSSNSTISLGFSDRLPWSTTKMPG